jgi:cystathionine beta-lyase/cystathionine gamma-synthase
VFENAQEVVAYNEGRSTKHLYSRYTNPTVVAAEKKLAAIDRAESALLFSSGQGATTTILLTHLKAGDEIVCAAAIYGGTLHLLEDVLAKFGVTPRFVSLEELARPESIIGERTRMVWFESPINPTLRCVGVSECGRAARGALGDRQHLRQSDQPATARARRRPGDAERHQVPERPQRRHRRDGQRAEGAGRAD